MTPDHDTALKLRGQQVADWLEGAGEAGMAETVHDLLGEIRELTADRDDQAEQVKVEKASFMAQMKNEAHHRNLLTAALARVAGLEAAAKKSRCPEVDALWAAIWRDQKKLDVALGQLSRGRLVTFGGRVNDLLDAIDYVIGHDPDAPVENGATL